MNKKQFTKIYEKYAEDIYRFCMFKTSNAETAEDLTSEIFIDAFKAEEDLDNPRAWLYKVARNKIYDHYNMAEKSNHLKNSESFEEVSESEISNFRSNTEETAINQINLENFEEELKNLDDESQDIIIMKIWEDMKFTEISESTGINLSTVKQKFYRGLEFVKSQLKLDEAKVKALSFGAIIAAAFKISMQPAYAFSSQTDAAIASSINNNLDINLIKMEKEVNESTGSQVDEKNSDNSGEIKDSNDGEKVGAVGLASAGSASNVTAANVAGAGIFGGMLATTGGKVALGLIAATALIASAGVGVAVLSQNDDELEEVVEEPEEVVEEPEEVVEDEYEPNIPDGWTVSRFDACGVAIPTPPQSGDYVTQQNGTTTAYEYYEYDSVTDYDNSAAVGRVTRLDGEILGSGNLDGVRISCKDNLNNLGLNAAYAEIEDRYLGFNAGLPADSKYNIEKVDTLTKWGDVEIIEFDVSGGIAELPSQSFVFVYNGLIYEVAVDEADSENDVINEAISTIFNNLDFYEVEQKAFTPEFRGNNCRLVDNYNDAPVDCRLVRTDNGAVLQEIKDCEPDGNPLPASNTICLGVYTVLDFGTTEGTIQYIITTGGDGGGGWMNVHSLNLISGNIDLVGNYRIESLLGFQSFIYDRPECNVDAVDMPTSCFGTLERLGSSECNDPSLEVYYTPGCFSNWNEMSGSYQTNKQSMLNKVEETNIDFYVAQDKYYSNR